ncbi:MAG: hypothetical protein A2Y38_14135 [Spirochaetes bacterium GWB1_59_5]|nr:MAG: hypothetical protein A2Y38_14135 [Spirochaetes bacterium GWB1_59_5]
MSWLEEQAKKADPWHDRAILETPDVVRELDALLMATYEPYIREELAKTGYVEAPPADERWIESKWIGPELSRALTFMLFDHLSYPFFQGVFSCTRRGFFMERECFLGFPRQTDPSLLFRILGEDSLRGNPPELTIAPSLIHPEWDVYFQITLSAGTGLETGPWTLHEGAKTIIKQVIEDSVEMYEISMVDSFSTLQDLENLLRAARRSYESG